MIKIFQLTLLAILVSLKGYAQSAARPFENGETLRYIVSYKVAFLNMDVALATIRIDSNMLDGEECYRVVCRAETAPAYKSFFNLEDTYTVWLNKDTLLPIQLINDNIQDRYTSHSEYYYDWDNSQVRTLYYNCNHPEPIERLYPIQENSRDAISAFIYLRTLPFEQFLKAKEEPLDLVFYDKIRPVKYSYVVSESERVRGHGKQLIHKFDCTLATSDGNGLDEGNSFELWFADSQRDNKAPIFFYSPIRVGSVRARLATPSELERYYK